MLNATDKTIIEFLSTPSGWRATFASGRSSCLDLNFYPRPPGGGRLCTSCLPVNVCAISIHALRVEGDP